ncbi:MAG: DUF4013 domain-containing protein [Chloroflexi bacterium]|nr:DUF4013 domain-containing protein [Chloroflexota bacterium]
MTYYTEKAKFDDVIRPDSGFYSDQELTGCGAYIGASVQYPLVGGTPTWTKLLIGAVLNFIPFFGSMVVAGYALRATRRVAHGDYMLPEWDDWVNDFVRGLIVTVGGFVYGLLLMFSMVLVVTIPVLMIFAFPMIMYPIAKFAVTDDVTAFVDVVGAYRAVFTRPIEALIASLSFYVVALVFSVLIAVGFVLLFVPGLMMAFGLTLAVAFQTGLYGRMAVDR